jgi:hypothetical protein
VRKLSGIALLVVAGASSPAAADVRGDQITGEVVSARGRWTRDGLIVTDAVIRADDGREHAVVQLGGRAGGYGQRMYPMPAPLEVGTRVTAQIDAGRLVHDVAMLTPQSFVRTGPTEAGHYLYWAGGCIFMDPDSAGTQDLPGDTEFDVIDRVLDTWNDAVSSCSYLQLKNGGKLPVHGTGIGRDGANRIIFRDERWCRPATDEVDEFCLPRGAAGLTTVTYVDDTSSSRDGEIVDADIELNGEEFSISENGETMGDAACLADLANTLTHEMGHVMGFDHTCRVPADPLKVDDQGNEVPLCSDAADDPAITEPTMFNFQDCGETKKQSPADDDINAVCSVYPQDDDPGVCEPIGVEGGCCSSGGGDAALLGPLLLTALLAAAGRRGRKRG